MDINIFVCNIKKSILFYVLLFVIYRILFYISKSNNLTTLIELTTLEQRRDRGDLIQVYKIIYGLEDVRLIKGLNFVNSDHFTRGNSLKLRRELVKNCTPRFNFLTNRVVDKYSIFMIIFPHPLCLLPQLCKSLLTFLF